MARILIIDDEPSIRTILDHTLRAAGHEVFLARNGKEGIELQRASPADVAIIDLFMPDQDGIETIIAFRRDFPKAGIIAISGNDPSGAMLTIARQLGAMRILDKPFESRTILAQIDDELRAMSKP